MAKTAQNKNSGVNNQHPRPKSNRKHMVNLKLSGLCERKVIQTRQLLKE